MPEFILNRPARHIRYYDLSDFTKGYVEAMFFTNGDTGAEDDHLLNNLGVGRLTRLAIGQIAADCTQFQRDQRNVLAAAYTECDYTPEQAGRDLWFTRQGHGVGFWCRQELAEDLQDLLTKGAKDMGESYVEVSRGWIYCR